MIVNQHYVVKKYHEFLSIHKITYISSDFNELIFFY